MSPLQWAHWITLMMENFLKTRSSACFSAFKKNLQVCALIFTFLNMSPKHLHRLCVTAAANCVRPAAAVEACLGSPLGPSECVWPVWLWRSCPCRWSSAGGSCRRAAARPRRMSRRRDTAADCGGSTTWWAAPAARGGCRKSSAERDTNGFILNKNIKEHPETSPIERHVWGSRCSTGQRTRAPHVSDTKTTKTKWRRPWMELPSCVLVV